MFSVKARSPDRPMTMSQWLEWRKAEDERMIQTVMTHIRSLYPEDEAWLEQCEANMRAEVERSFAEQTGKGTKH